MQAVSQSATASKDFALGGTDDPTETPNAGVLAAIGSCDVGLVGGASNSQHVLVVEHV